MNAINRRQMVPKDFEEEEGGAVRLNADGRKKLLAMYQAREQEEVDHALFKEKIPVGLLPHVQARLLARTLRGEIAAYIPYVPQ